MMKWGLLRSCFIFSPIYSTLILKVGRGTGGVLSQTHLGLMHLCVPTRAPNSSAAAQWILVELKESCVPASHLPGLQGGSCYRFTFLGTSTPWEVMVSGAQGTGETFYQDSLVFLKLSKTTKSVVSFPCFFFFFFWAAARWILVLQPVIQPTHPAVESWSPNHWTTREFSALPVLFILHDWYFHFELFSWIVQVLTTSMVSIGIRDKLTHKYVLFGKSMCSNVHVPELYQERVLLTHPLRTVMSHIQITVHIPKWWLNVRSVCLMKDIWITEMASLWDEHWFHRALPSLYKAL